MPMNLTLPSRGQVVGDAGHTTDQHTIVKALEAVGAAMPYTNVRCPPYGATGNGTTDDTAAIQAAINAATASGCVVYIPAGEYKITSALTYSGTTPLIIVGDGTAGRRGHRAGVTTIRPDFAPGHAFSVSNCPYFYIRDLDIAADGNNSGGPAADYAAVHTSSVNTMGAARMQVYKGTGNFCFNTAFHIVNSFTSYILESYITGEEEAVWMDGGIVMTCRDVTTTTTRGNGYGGFRMDNAARSAKLPATIYLDNCYTQVGDWGLWAGGGGATDYPTFIFIQNFQVNNPNRGGAYFGSGSRIWADMFWVSCANSPAGSLTYGVHFGTNWKGMVYFTNSQFIHPSGHGAWIQGGKGFTFTNCSFGACGNLAASSYDDIHIAAGVSNVIINACTFDTDPFAGVSGPPARSAVYLEAGVGDVQLTSSHGAGASAYAIAAVMDFTNNLVRKGNIGLGVSEESTAAGSTVSTASFKNLSGSFTIPPYDMTVGAVYKLTAWGHGTEATGTAVSLTVRAVLGASPLGSCTASANPAAGTAFAWTYTAYIYVTATGTAGAVNLVDSFTWNGVTTQHSNTAFPVNTHVSGALVFQGKWAAITGTPAISCDGSMLERVQPVPAR